MNSNEIFKQGSTTYFNSSIFFPPQIKSKVTVLYGYVRRMDDLVDQLPQNQQEFFRLKELTKLALNGEKVEDNIINDFISLSNNSGFQKDWIISFINSIEMDLVKNEYENIEDLFKYIYGSAEVIGMMMSKILILDEKTLKHARMLGRAMQFVNFIRDINEDLELKRTYFPKNEIEEFEVILSKKFASENKEKFNQFIRFQILRYFKMQDEAEEGFKEIPKRYLIPIKTASDMYKWTALKIYENPYIVFQKKVKPSIQRILFTGFVNTIEI